jgi:hypothetical protein
VVKGHKRDFTPLGSPSTSFPATPPPISFLKTAPPSSLSHTMEPRFRNDYRPGEMTLNSEGMTPLMYGAAIITEAATMRMLIRLFPDDVNTRDRHGNTALQYSYQSGNKITAHVLLTCSTIDSRIRNIYGFSAMHYAKLDNNQPFIMLLASAHDADEEVLG